MIIEGGVVDRQMDGRVWWCKRGVANGLGGQGKDRAAVVTNAKPLIATVVPLTTHACTHACAHTIPKLQTESWMVKVAKHLQNIFKAGEKVS